MSVSHTESSHSAAPLDRESKVGLIAFLKGTRIGVLRIWPSSPQVANHLCWASRKLKWASEFENSSHTSVDGNSPGPSHGTGGVTATTHLVIPICRPPPVKKNKLLYQYSVDLKQEIEEQSCQSSKKCASIAKINTPIRRKVTLYIYPLTKEQALSSAEVGEEAAVAFRWQVM